MNEREVEELQIQNTVNTLKINSGKNIIQREERGYKEDTWGTNTTETFFDNHLKKESKNEVFRLMKQQPSIVVVELGKTKDLRL